MELKRAGSIFLPSYFEVRNVKVSPKSFFLRASSFNPWPVLLWSYTTALPNWVKAVIPTWPKLLRVRDSNP